MVRAASARKGHDVGMKAIQVPLLAYGSSFIANRFLGSRKGETVSVSSCRWQVQPPYSFAGIGGAAVIEAVGPPTAP